VTAELVLQLATVAGTTVASVAAVWVKSGVNTAVTRLEGKLDQLSNAVQHLQSLPGRLEALSSDVEGLTNELDETKDRLRYIENAGY
jgi:hypothetical protein